MEDLPETSRTDLDIKKVVYALRHRYSKQNLVVPPEIQSVIVVFDLLEMNIPMVKELQLRGSQSTNKLAAAKELLSQHTSGSLDERQVAGALLFLVLTPDRRQYSPAIFVQAIHDHIERSFDWQSMIQELDFMPFEISREQFLSLFDAFLPIAKQNPQFDIQRLWGGRWRHPQTQLSFVKSFLSLGPSELDAQSIPGLRQAYDPRDSSDGPEGVTQLIETALKDPMISLDAVTAVYDLLIRPDEPPSPQEEVLLAEIIGAKDALFLCSSLGVQKPWTAGQAYIMKNLFASFLRTDRPESSYVLHTMWKQNKQWVAVRLMETHSHDPLDLVLILDRAQQHSWLDDLYSLTNGFGLDIAALAHRKNLLDLDQWAEDKLTQDPNGLVDMISRFLVLKTADELRTARDEQPVPRTVSLSMKTVYDMLAILDRHMADRSELKAQQRQCLQAYPRLIIFCEGIEENVDVDCKQSNRLPRAADQEMQELYKRMYSADLEVKQILEYLRECKGSNDPTKVDLYACMIHGLFDEFSCFGEYPLGPLATTAVLFGGIISYGLISDLTLRVGQEMILDAVRDYPPEASMYKFGLQALLQALERLREPEWWDYCSRLVQIPGLRSTEPYKRAVEVLSEQSSGRGGCLDEQLNGSLDGMELPNGDIDEFVTPDTTIHFKSINAEPVLDYDKPDDETQDKVVFFFNNVSEQNLKTRLSQLQDALQEKHHQWFASFLVDERAKVEPNYQRLYLDILGLLGNKSLWHEVLRETYVSVQKILNAESTLQSSQERKNLKNLATWLGSLTIARDKPIKHKSISFLDLLVEGLDTQRLLLVIPFTCNVLAQGARSTVFKPPNPWVVEILAGLLELYNNFEIKTNQKFDIEVLFKEFGLVTTSFEESKYIRNRPLQNDDLSNALLPDGLESFEDMSLGNINRTVRNSRFDPEAIAASLPDLENTLVFPPSSGTATSQARLREVVHDAVRRAISEIIGPVVERSITIATIATFSLVQKDFAREGDEDRVRRSAHQMVRKLSGSLALVTCKEPLKMSMTNYIRMAQAEFQEPVAEGAILMCVNDNLDAACGIVEKQAEERSIAEIDTQIYLELQKRAKHRAEYPNEPYMDPNYSHWAGYIPDPFKMSLGGLTPEQEAIYLDFARQSRGPTSHGQTGSADSGRQLPDVLQDAFASLPSIHTPAETLAVPHRPPQQQQQQLGRMLPPPGSNSIPQAQANGYLDLGLVEEQVDTLLGDLIRAIRGEGDRTWASLSQEPTISNQLHQTLETLTSSPDIMASECVRKICAFIYSGRLAPIEVEVFVLLLKKLCDGHPSIRKDVAVWTTSLDEQSLLNIDVTLQLVKADIIQLKQLDVLLGGLLYDGEDGAIDFMSQIMDELLLNDNPIALRADFTQSLDALGHLAAQAPDQPRIRFLLQKLKDWGVNDANDRPDERGIIKEHQLSYIFSEWTAICNAYPTDPSGNVFAAFIFQLHQKQLINSTEDMADFLRVCICEAMKAFEDANPDIDGTSNEAFSKIDWLSRLIVLLVRHQGETNGAVRLDKAGYMKSILSVITLIMNRYHVDNAERFSQRLFFRLLSSILCDWHDIARESYEHDRDIPIVFAENFLMMAPRLFPEFTYSWLMLISHRVFMPTLLRLPYSKVSFDASFQTYCTDCCEGWEPFATLIEAALSYICQFLKPSSITPLAIDLYRGILRIILILHHDFPEFLAENHFRLCNAIPRHCTQLHNLVLSAYPSSFPELPNPFYAGLKVDRVDGIRKAPVIAGDPMKSLIRDNIKEALDASFRGGDISGERITYLANAAYISTPSGLAVNSSLIHALVLYIGQSAIASAGESGGQAFTSNSPHASLMAKLAKELDPEPRYYFLSAMAHQLRYPNSHTHYFSYAILDLFGTGLADQKDLEVRQQITRVLLERLHVIKPHPWGLVITMLELIKNPEYSFFQLPFILGSPGVGVLPYMAKCFAHP